MPKFTKGHYSWNFFSGFIQKLIRSSTHHYQSIHNVWRLCSNSFWDVLLTRANCPKLQRAIIHEVFFSYFIQNLFRSSFKALASFVIPPAYEVCRGVYSFRLSVSSSVRPCVRTNVNILRQSFAWSFFLLYIFLKAYTLGCWCVFSVTTRWLQNSWHHSAAAADPRSRSRT